MQNGCPLIPQTLAENTAIFPESHTLNLGGKLLTLRPAVIMAILNTTPDSFWSGSRVHRSIPQLLERAEQALQQGADILDVGGMSTRPGAIEIPVKEELERIVPAIKALALAFPQTPLSVDTYRAEVAQAALDEGAALVNDVSGGTFDPNLFQLVAQRRVPYVLTHTPGKPSVMQEMTHYNEPIEDVVFRFFTQQLVALRQLGINDVILDPGFGFGKTQEQNYRLLKNLHQFAVLNLPILAGLSRKGMIWKALGVTPEDALPGTIVAHVLALQQGVSLLRVHDVEAARQAIAIVEQFNQAG
jgi:dihydropteroate synthase